MLGQQHLKEPILLPVSLTVHPISLHSSLDIAATSLDGSASAISEAAKIQAGVVLAMTVPPGLLPLSR
jgi:hypothetical protein